MQIASLVAQLLKNPPVMQETWVLSLGQGDPLEKGMYSYIHQYSCLDSSMDRAAWHAAVHGAHKKLDPTEQLSTQDKDKTSALLSDY